MIKAQHAAWADGIFHPYVRWLCKRHFHAIHLLGQAPETNPDLPLLLLPNHSTWWDGFFVYLLNKKLFRRKAYLMMLDEQLSRYRFFARLGAYSINPQSSGSIKESIKYSIEILKQRIMPKPLLCIFPQGELLPWEKRPLGYKSGVETIISGYGGKANFLPLAIKTEFLHEQLPEAFFCFGENLVANSNTFAGMQRLQEIEESLLDELSRRIAKGEKGTILLSGHQSVNARFDMIKSKAHR
ncbi:lysophospholipid acyltransferase family protein [candidate division KSB1 bacterium]|nr:lysophospholipid acyltransferase family protein [candidate division KSB1 bacterium]